MHKQKFFDVKSKNETRRFRKVANFIHNNALYVRTLHRRMRKWENYIKMKT